MDNIQLGVKFHEGEDYDAVAEVVMRREHRWYIANLPIEEWEDNLPTYELRAFPDYTEEELAEAHLAELQAQLEELKDNILTAIALGDTEWEAEAKEAYQALLNEE